MIIKGPFLVAWYLKNVPRLSRYLLSFCFVKLKLIHFRSLEEVFFFFFAKIKKLRLVDFRILAFLDTSGPIYTSQISGVFSFCGSSQAAEKTG